MINNDVKERDEALTLLELTVYCDLALAVTVDGDVETIIFKDFLSTLQGCVIINYLVRL